MHPIIANINRLNLSLLVKIKRFHIDNPKPITNPLYTNPKSHKRYNLQQKDEKPIPERRLLEN